VPTSKFSIGDAVFTLGSALPGHTNAEYFTAHYSTVARKPKSMSFGDAAAFPLVGLTAWELFEQLEVHQGTGSILIVNGAGGVGSVAIQLAKNVFNIPNVIATASREASRVPFSLFTW